MALNPPRLLYLATADARGHLMRAQLLTHALRAQGAHVDVLTTSAAGMQFLRRFGIDAALLSPRYAVQFDARQNMRAAATDANVAAYLLHPARMLRDILRLRRRLRGVDLILNDSFHPALLVMGMLPGWRRKIMHVYGASLRAALQGNFDGRLPRPVAALFARLIGWQIDAAAAQLEHDFAQPRLQACGRRFRLPTPVALAAPAAPGAPPQVPTAAVYLNPHFRDPALAQALEQGLQRAGLHSHRVGEGYADRAGWVAEDPQWIACAATSTLLVSAPGMAALSVAQVYRRPILLLLTEQPEQQRNARRAAARGLPHRTVVWRGDGEAFAHSVAAACRALQAEPPPPAPEPAPLDAPARLQLWVHLILALARGQCVPSADAVVAAPAPMSVRQEQGT
ncbi:hypothetical protein [Xanthomonas bonasiae]|uniref:hypothetical protein n=1 Tax=Xanthomonas bonasiae TaxID=2810351 RepID=UPI00296B23D0|nr:hypothetical protein [Xanthomonas surreyensis]